MLIRLVSAVRRKGTQNPLFVKRVPTDLRERLAGLTVLVPIGPERVPCRFTAQTTTIRLSLRTAVPSEVKVRQAEMAAFFETLWTSLQASKPITLTHRQAVALSKDIFEAWASEGGQAVSAEFNGDGSVKEVVQNAFVPPEAWGSALAHLETVAGEGEDPEKLEPVLGPLVDRSLRERGIGAVDRASRSMVLSEFLRSLRDAFTVQKRQAGGDYSPAPEQQRFPAWEAPKPTEVADRHASVTVAPRRGSGKVSLRGLTDRWWAEAEKANRSLSTLAGYRRTVNGFADHLGHDDAALVTVDDVIRFKDARIAAGASLKTVKDSDLVALKTVFGWATGNGLIATNPATGVRVLKAKRITTRSQGFTAEEATALLSQSIRHSGAGNEKPQTTAAKRWVPWLCAYTGARVGEMVQLRKEDVRRAGDLWVLTITPEAGTVKDKEVREVVLHSHLIELGFADFVATSKAGPLFLAVKPGEDIRGRWQATKNRLAEFARAVVPDDRVRPNHGWRHSFVTIGRQAGIEDSVLYAIGGWAAPTVGGRYGSVTLQAQAAAFAKFPRFAIGETAG